MHLALISARFTPESSPGAKRVSDLVAALRAAGHRTTVLTQWPHYPDLQAFAEFPRDAGRVTIGREELADEVWRFRPHPAAKGNLLARLWAEACFAYRTSRRGTRLAGVDGVFATSPYIFSLWAAGTYGLPMWLDLRDLTWEYARELRRQNLLSALGYRLLKRLALRSFHAAVRISTTTAGQRQYLIDQGIPAAKISVVPNGVPRHIVAELTRLGQVPRGGGPLRMVYAGLLGFPQGLGFAVESLEGLVDTNVELHIYGEGVDRPALTAYCQARNLTQVHFHGHVAQAQYLEALATADLLYASLRPGSSLVAAMPSKIWEYMAAGKAILFAGSGEASDAIRRAQAGLCVPYGDGERFRECLRRFVADEEFRRECGAHGRRWVREHQMRETINAGWVEALTEALSAASARRADRLPHRLGQGAEEPGPAGPKTSRKAGREREQGAKERVQG